MTVEERIGLRIVADKSINICIATGIQSKSLEKDFELHEELREYLIGLVTNLHNADGTIVVTDGKQRRAMITGFIAAVNAMNKMEKRR